MPFELKDIAARRKAAQVEKDQIQPILDEVYDYVIPYRKGVSRTGKGEKRTNRVFDHTAIVSAFRSANRVANDISPAGQQAFDLKPGPLARATMPQVEQEKMAVQLAIIQTVVGAHFQTGEWDLSLAEMALDLMAGTGCMLIVPHPARGTSRFVTASLEEVRITSDGYNEVNGIFWCKKWTLQALQEEFQNEKSWPKELQDKLTEKPEHEIELYQDTVLDVKRARWVRIAWSKDAKSDNDKNGFEFQRSESRTCPWLTPRYFKVPGETYGRGPALLAMPTIKAVNTAVKLNLQAAAIAMLGIYTAIDDGVFNPSNAPITPGVFWKVARNGGTLGPSISKLPDPRIDLSQIIIKEFRMAIQEAMNDQQLPPDGAAVRSATEIMERVKRLAGDHQGAFGRLIMEIIVPAVKRVMEIAYDLKQLPETVNIDRLFVDIQVASPIALAREAEKWQKVTRYVELVVMWAQANAVPGVKRFVKFDALVPDMARDLAIPGRYVPTEDERIAIDKDDATQAAAAMAAHALTGGAAAGGGAAAPANQATGLAA
jgi:Bacteriophage head to tail connecting protein